jgi:hypothetical protein
LQEKPLKSVKESRWIHRKRNIQKERGGSCCPPKQFFWAMMRESEPLKKIRNGLILTEQTLLEAFDGKPTTHF